MKRIAVINNKKNELKVLIHPHTPIYLRFCSLLPPIMCNKTCGGISAKKTGGIALEKLTPYSHTKTNPHITLKKKLTPHITLKKPTPCLERTTQQSFQHI